MRVSLLDKFEIVICFFANMLLARLVSRPIILCFHCIEQNIDNLFYQIIGVTSPSKFTKIVKYFRLLGYRFASLDEMLKDQNLKKPTRLAALTFDDGFKNIYQYAYPFLKERKIPFTLFLTTATIDSSELLWLHKLIILLIALPFNVVNLLYSQFYNTSNKSLNIYDVINKIVSNKEKKDILRFINHVTFRIPISNETEKEIANRLYLTVDELLEMREYGLSIQAHGHEHLWLSDLSQTETYKEIYSCFQYITQILRRKPSFYGLAFGVSNPFIKEIISELGLNGIVTSERRLLDKTDDPYCLPRISVKNDNEYIYRFLTRWYLSAIMKKIKSCQFRSFILRHRKRI